jgi:hypothetical protein
MEEKTNYKRKQSLITIITDIILIIVSFIMLIDSIIGEKSNILVRQNLKKVFKSFQPIEDIKPAMWQCPRDYEPIYETTFEHSSQGCYDNKSDHYYEGSCSSNHVKGREIEEIKNLPMKIWRDSLVCIKRLQQFGIFEKGNSCPRGSKYCGIIDDFGNFICIGIARECPVTSIKISSEKNQNNFTSFPIGDNVYLSFTNKLQVNEKIPFNFIMSLDFPCVMEDRISNVTPPFQLLDKNRRDLYGCVREDFTLEQFKKYNNSITEIDLRDYRYKVLDSIRYYDFLKENDILQDIYQPYNEYFQKYNYTNFNISLYLTGNTGINYTCFTKDNSSFVKDQLSESKKNLQFNLLIIELINITLLSFFVSLLALVKTKSSFDLKHVMMSYLKLVLAGVFIYFNLTLIIECYKQSDDFTEIIEYASYNQCFEIYTVYALEAYNIQKNILQTRRYNEFLFWGSAIYASFVCLQFIHLTIKTYSKFKNSKKMTVDARTALKQYLGERS